MRIDFESRVGNLARSPLALAPMALAWTSCITPATDAISGSPITGETAETTEAPSDVLWTISASAATPAAVPATSVASQWTDFDLALWNDPAFRKRFTESYLAETEIEPRLTEQERSHLEKAVEYIGDEKVDRAVALLQKHGGEGASAVFDFTLANIYFQQEELFQASVSYSDAVAKYPKFRRAWKNLALVHVRRGDFDEAAAAFARVIELGGGDGVTYGLLGYAYTNLEQHMAAESAYRLAVLLDPITPDWSTGLARSFFKQRRYAEAASVCGHMLDKEPNRADLWLLQANAFIGLGQPLRAAENFEVASTLGAATFDTLTTLGDIYVNEQLFDLGVASYLRGLELRPDGDIARVLRATKLLTAHGAQAECQQLVDGIEALVGDGLPDADRKQLLAVRVLLASARGAGEEEAKALEEIVALDPLDGEALILLGQYYGRAGDAERGAFYFERAAGMEAFEADAKVRHAQMLVGQQRYGEALPLLKRAQVIRPRDNIQDYLEQIERAAQGR
jgi:tetratricopeptide (TPR) repeat protein